MINKENMKKAQKDLFDFLEKIIKKKYDDLVLECFLKFKSKTVFEKTMRRILKGKDEFECEEYSITLSQLQYIIDELQKLKKKRKKKSPKKSNDKKEKKKKKKLKKVGEDCKEDTECKGKGCCDKGKCEKGNKKVCKNKGKPEKKDNKKIKKTDKLTKEDCEEWEKNKKNVKNDKVINIKNGKSIKYTKKNGEPTKKVDDINKECEKIMKKTSPFAKPKVPKRRKRTKKKLKTSPPKKTPVKIKKKSPVKTKKKSPEKKNKLTEVDLEQQIIINTLNKKYEYFEKKSIDHIAGLAAQIDIKGNKKQVIDAYRKLYKRIRDFFNNKFAGNSKDWIYNQIPIKIRKELGLLKDKIFRKFMKSPPKSPVNVPYNPLLHTTDEEREQNELLAQLETDDLNKEYKKIIESGIVKNKNIIYVLEDGNCLFNSIEGFLYHKTNKKPLSKKEERKLAKELRKKLIRWMLKNKNKKIEKLDMTFKQYVEEIEINDENRNISDDVESFEEYVEWIGEEYQWGGQAEITALAMMFGRSIIVFDRYSNRLDQLGHWIPNSDPIVLFYRGTVEGGDHFQYYGERELNTIIENDSEEKIEELYESDFESEDESKSNSPVIQKKKSKSKSKSKTPEKSKSKSKTPEKSKSKSKSHSKTHQQILDDLNNNQLNQEDMDKILKKLNLKTQKEYLKELILIGLNKL